MEKLKETIRLRTYKDGDNLEKFLKRLVTDEEKTYSDIVLRESWLLDRISWVDVTAYKAKGDGITDDFAAITNALEALNAAGGGALVFPYTPNNYKLTDELILYSNIHIIGIGKPRITQTTAGKKIFTGSSLSNILIKNLNLYGRGANATYVGGEDIIRLNSCSDIILRNLLIEEVRGAHGICLDATTKVLIERCTIDEFSYSGITILTDCEDIWVVNNTIRDCVRTTTPAYGVASGAEANKATNVKRLHVLNNYVENIKSWTGLDCHGGEDIFFIENIVKDCRSGIIIQGVYADGIATLKNVHVIDNNVDCTSEDVSVGTANSGIEVKGDVENSTVYYGTDITIRGNTVKHANIHLQSGNYGGITCAYLKRLTIEGNNCFRNYNAGIKLYDENYQFSLASNKCIDNYGGFASGVLIRTSNHADGVIENNIWKHTGDAGYVQEYGIRVLNATTRVLERNNVTDVNTAKYGATLFYIKQEFAANYPTAGNWEVGDIVLEDTPTAGNPPGWVCVTAGAPGTWKAMADLEV